MYYLGVDLGGTNIACAVVTSEGQLLGKASVPTGLPASADEIAARIVSCCHMAVEASGQTMENIFSVGIGPPELPMPTRALWNTAAIWDFTIPPFPIWWGIS